MFTDEEVGIHRGQRDPWKWCQVCFCSEKMCTGILQHRYPLPVLHRFVAEFVSYFLFIPFRYLSEMNILRCSSYWYWYIYYCREAAS
jgi:hypothetical protein